MGHSLLPFKLLCMEDDAGTFGSQRLSEALNPMMFGFVDRLRSLSYAECEVNRFRREGMEDEVGANGTGGGGKNPEEDGTGGWHGLAHAPIVEEYVNHRIIIGGYAQDFHVDLLIEPLT